MLWWPTFKSRARIDRGQNSKAVLLMGWSWQPRSYSKTKSVSPSELSTVTYLRHSAVDLLYSKQNDKMIIVWIVMTFHCTHTNTEIYEKCISVNLLWWICAIILIANYLDVLRPHLRILNKIYWTLVIRRLTRQSEFYLTSWCVQTSGWVDVTGRMVKWGNLGRWSDGQVGHFGIRGQGTFWFSAHIHHVGAAADTF